MSSVRGNASFKERFSRFAQKLKSPRLAPMNPRWKSAIFGAAFLCCAGILAWGAQEASYSRAFEDWQLRHTPSQRTWIHALSTLGWIEPTGKDVIHRTLKKLPATLDSAGSIWASPDLEWVIVFTDPEGVIPQKLFCRDCTKPPERLEPMGTGWSGFDSITERLEKAKKTVSTAKARKIVKFVDAREIQY